MRIGRLVDAPQHVDTVVLWIWEEWGKDSTASLDLTRERLVDPQNCPATLLATEDDAPLGLVSFRRFQRSSGEDPSLFIDALYVLRELRGRGVGTALLEQAVVDAKRFAFDVFVFTDRRDWYERRGWTLTEAKPVGEPVVLVRPT